MILLYILNSKRVDHSETILLLFSKILQLKSNLVWENITHNLLKKKKKNFLAIYIYIFNCSFVKLIAKS